MQHGALEDPSGCAGRAWDADRRSVCPLRVDLPAVRTRFALPLALVAALFAALAIAAPATAKKPQRCNGMKQLCERRLDQVVLPGTHNAMSALDYGFSLPNQTLTIPEQLDGGVRAMLLDTHYGRLQPDGEVRTDDDGTVTEGVRGTYLCHVLCEIGALPLAPTLRQISRWLRENPNEVLVIENEDYISANDFVAAMERSGLLDHVYRGSRAPWAKLKRMIRTDHRVVMLSDNEAKGDPPWYRPTYEGLLQETPYSFNPPSKLTDPANWPESCAPNRGGTDGSLFLMNHWSPSTPPAEPDYETSAEVNARSVLLGRAETCAQLRGRYPNIVAVDQFTAGGLIPAVRKLNRLPARVIHPPGT